jgi:23S rRNA (adenine2030-N6)-methyltransferase
MLAYRHAFHAGNHADVLKHVVLVRVLRHMNQKDKGYRVVDTHAGAGIYALDSPQARQKGEYRQGIGRLWARDDLPEPVADYVGQVRQLNVGGTLQTYPGSPWLARALMRPQDHLRLFDLHPADHEALHDRFARQPAVEVRRDNGFSALKSQLPPPSRRAVVLIDPSYEGLGDYGRTVDAMRDALRRFADGVYIVWYPLVHKPGAQTLLHSLKALAPRGWLHARLSVQAADAQGFGLAGSGVIVLNPPYTLHEQLRTTLPWLSEALAQHAAASHLLEQLAA